MSTGVCVITHANRGIYLGCIKDKQFWSNDPSGGPAEALTFENYNQAKQFVNMRWPKEFAVQCLIRSADSGRWMDLQRAGLPIGKMSRFVR